MGFMFGKISAKPSLKLHLLWLGMQPLCQDRNLRCKQKSVVNRTRTMSKLFIYVTFHGKTYVNDFALKRAKKRITNG